MRELFQRDIAYRIGDFGEIPPPATNTKLGLVWQYLESSSIAFGKGEYRLAATRALGGIELLRSEDPSATQRCYGRALWEIKADAYAHMRQPEEAIRCGTQMLAESIALAEEIGHTLHLALSYLSLGHYHVDAGAYSEALEHYRTAATLVPLDTPRGIEAELLGSLADCHANLGNLREALVAADRAIALSASDPELARQERFRLMALDRRAFYLAWNGQCDTAVIESGVLVARLRELVSTDPAYRSDLARCLDHRAEILERSHRHADALTAAEESTALRRQALLQRSAPRLSLLRSMVTLARLAGHLGNSARAIELCEEAGQLMSDSDIPEGFPADLRAQIVTCHGRNLMALGCHEQGENRLLEGIRLFRHLAHQGRGAAIWRDAQAEVWLDLGKLLWPQEPARAKRCFARAVAWKRGIQRKNPHPFHRSSFAEALVLLGHAELGSNAVIPALARFDLAIAIFAELDIVPGDFPELATRISAGVVEAARQIIQSTEQQWGRFRHLARALSAAIDLADDEILEELQEQQRAFQRLWLEHFIDRSDGAGIVEFLSFAHGRRLALLAQAELKCRAAQENLSEDERRFLDIQRSLRRIDLEMAEILSARVPSLIGTEPASFLPGVIAGASHAIAGAGRILEQERDRLFHSYVALRDKLISEGRHRTPSSGIIEIDQIIPQACASTAVAVWCIPQAFDIDHHPLLVILSHSPAPALILPMPELNEAHGAFSKLLRIWRFGRSGMRGGNPAPSDPISFEQSAELETVLWRQMKTLWERLAGKLAPHDIANLHMVTHAEAHNLPWLGACPESIKLRQFPSLDFYLRRRNALPPPTPSPEHPLILLVEEPDDDPLNTLYHVPLEVEAIRQVWPGAVIEATHATAVDCSEASAIWIIGHGFSRNGFPLLGKGAGRQRLTDTTIFRNPDFRAGLVYASTCYMGNTIDTSGEPIGLSGLAALQDQIPLSAGAVSPIDDLDAALLAILFHAMWRETGDAPSAFHLARIRLSTRAWGDAEKDVFSVASARVRPGIRDLALSHAEICQNQIRKLYPALTARSHLQRQFAIQNRGRNILRLWGTDPCVASDMDTLSMEPNADSLPNMFRDDSVDTARYFSWFG